MSLTGAVASAAPPVTVSGTLDFNALVTGDQTANTFTLPVLVNSGDGRSATLNFTISSATGELFNKLDGNTRLSIGTAFDDENHVNVGENPSFDISLVSQTGDPSTIGVNIESLGMRDTGSPSVSWTSDVSTTPVVYTNFTGETDFDFDDPLMFHLLNSSDYSGDLQVTANQFQFTDIGSGVGGINYNVQFAAVPEPTSVAIWSLLGLGLAGYGYYRHRRKK